jgi:sulfite oxidase
LLLTGTGIVVSSIVPVGRSLAQQPDASGKALHFLTTDPARNGQPDLEKLVQSWLTPTEHFYVRSHAPNPVIDADSFRLSVEGLVRRPESISLSQLSRLPSHQITATLTCAGNRRVEFNREGEVGGVQWGSGAIGNATWTGVALSDVLRAAELLDNAKHVWFEGLDQIQRDDGVIPFGGSIPIEKAMIDGPMPGTLLAQQMNGAPLLPDHGFPLRTVVPGYIGARSVKWLGRIVVSDQPSPNHYLQSAYKIVRSSDPIEWTESGPIYRYPINGAIATPGEKVKVKAGPIEVRGYVLPSGRAGAKIQRVMVSADGGKNWTLAELIGRNAGYCWQLWKATVNVGPQTKELIMRAGDTAGDFMPARVPWNAKGYLQNSWYRQPIEVS